jgi:hypothetical protein
MGTFPMGMPAFESLDELTRAASDPATDGDAGSIQSMMENLQFAALTGTDYREPVETPIAFSGLNKVTAGVPLELESPYTPAVTLTPAPGSPLAKNYNEGTRAAVRNFLINKTREGTSVEYLVELFESSDPAYAALIREVAETL